MKKLMIAACAVAFAVAVQAATVNWSDSKALYNGAGEAAAKMASGSMAYLIQVTAATAAADIVAGFQDKTLSAATIQGYAIDSNGLNGSNKAGAQGSSTDALTAGESEKAYYVVFNGDNMFVSDVAEAMYDATTTSYTFDYSTTLANSKALPSTGTYAGAGWYTAATAAPEPTSGLLLLLGVAGLALRRRRA